MAITNNFATLSSSRKHDKYYPGSAVYHEIPVLRFAAVGKTVCLFRVLFLRAPRVPVVKI
jgi:hypothetical protein